MRVWILLSFLVLGLRASEEAKPNIIFFIVDDLGLMDISVPSFTDAAGEVEAHPLNEWYRTPHLERLAAQGVRFSQFYAHTVCSPTRVSIMTGQNSARHRTTQFISPRAKNTGARGPEGWNWEGIKPGDVTLAGLIRDAGYRTIHVGKGHFAPPGHPGEDPSTLGFDVNIGGAAHGQPGSHYGQDGYGNMNPNRVRVAVPHLEEYHGTDTFLTEALTQEAIKQIDVALKKRQPFFLHLSHYAVHSPFQSDPRFADHYTGSDKGERGEAFATLVEGMDKSLGDVMRHLQATGIAENTLIIFMGDNGTAAPFGSVDELRVAAPLRGKKASRWEGGVRTPFVAAWAARNDRHSAQVRLPIADGEVQTRFGFAYDVFPTLLAISEAEVPDGHVIDGADLAPLLQQGGQIERPEAFLSHFPHEHANSYFTSYREDNWKLVYHYFPESDALMDRYELYDLATDPAEFANLAAEDPRQLRHLTAAMIASLESMDALYPVANGTEQRPQLPQ